MVSRRRDWTSGENELVVSAYFDQLARQQRNEPFIGNHTKIQYVRRVSAKTGRSERGVREKFHNICHWLTLMGHQTLNGYTPRQNAQAALKEIILRQINEQYPWPLELLEKEAEKSGDFEPDNIEDARIRKWLRITQRRGQVRFRQALLEAYEGKCAATGFNSHFSLEACHIVPYRGPDTNHVSNGLLLRSDIHTLFDLGKISVETSDMTWILADSLRDSSYSDLFGITLTQPSDPAKRPSVAALEQQRILAGL